MAGDLQPARPAVDRLIIDHVRRRGRWAAHRDPVDGACPADVQQGIGWLKAAGTLVVAGTELSAEVSLTTEGNALAAGSPAAESVMTLLTGPPRLIPQAALEEALAAAGLSWRASLLVSLGAAGLGDAGDAILTGGAADHFARVFRLVARIHAGKLSDLADLTDIEHQALRRHAQSRSSRSGALFAVRRRKHRVYALGDETAPRAAPPAGTAAPPTAHPYRSCLARYSQYLESQGFRRIDRPSATLRYWNTDATGLSEHHRAASAARSLYLDAPRTSPPLRRATWNGGPVAGGQAPPGEQSRLVLRGQATAVVAECLAAGDLADGCYYALVPCFSAQRPTRNFSTEFMMLDGLLLGRSATMPDLIRILAGFARTFAGGEGLRIVSASYPVTSVAVRIATDSIPAEHLGGGGHMRADLLRALHVSRPAIAFWLGVNEVAKRALGVAEHADLYRPAAAAGRGDGRHA